MTLVPLPVKPGDYRFPLRLPVCLSVRPSVCLSVRLSICPSVHSVSVHLVFLFFSQSHFEIGTWNLVYEFLFDMIQIKFDFCHVWPSITRFIAVCKNFVFQTFLSCLLWYWLEIWYMNLSWHNTDQVLLRLTYFYMSYFPLLKFRFPDFSLSSFEILIWNFIYEFVLT